MAPNDRSSSRGGTGGKKPSTGSRPGASSARSSSGKGTKPPSGSRSGPAPRKVKTGRRSGPRPEREEPRTAGPKQWGSLGRKGAGRLTSPEFDARDSVGATGRDDRPAPANRQSDRWVRVDDDVRSEATEAVRRRASRRSRAVPSPAQPRAATKATARPQAREPSRRGAGVTSARPGPAAVAPMPRPSWSRRWVRHVARSPTIVCATRPTPSSASATRRPGPCCGPWLNWPLVRHRCASCSGSPTTGWASGRRPCASSRPSARSPTPPSSTPCWPTPTGG